MQKPSTAVRPGAKPAPARWVRLASTSVVMPAAVRVPICRGADGQLPAGSTSAIPFRW